MPGLEKCDQMFPNVLELQPVSEIFLKFLANGTMCSACPIILLSIFIAD